MLTKIDILYSRVLCECGDFRRQPRRPRHQPRRPQHQRLVLLWVLNFLNDLKHSSTDEIDILSIECCVNVAILDANHVDHNTND